MIKTTIFSACVLLACACLIAIVGCSRAGQSAAVPEAGVTVLDCSDNAFHSTSYGVLINNTWNKRAAGAGPWRQCLQSRQRAGSTDYGWHWSWPTRDGIYAYPQILVGSSPWSDKASNDARFPRSIAATETLVVDFDTEANFNGKKNLAVEFWITDALREASVQGGSKSPAIKAELMIWTEASDGLVSKDDRPAAVVEIDGATWTVYIKRNWGDVSGGTGQRWTFITYHAAAPSPSARLDARKFFQDAINRGVLTETDVIHGVELGNEIISGSGSTWIKRFELAVR